MEELIISEIEIPAISILNKDIIINNLKEGLKLYDRVLTEETLKEGKEDKAKLNKLLKAIEDKRKEIKKLVMIPYDEIEKDFKEITNLISETTNKLDIQVKEFEEEEKRIKQIEINKLLELNTTGINIDNSKWLNSTYKLKDVKQEILDFVEKYNQDMKILENEDVVIKDYYNRTLNISATLIEKKRIKDLRTIEETKKEIVEETKPIEIIEEIKEIEFTTKYNLKVEVTRNQAILLKQFLTNNNIEYTLEV